MTVDGKNLSNENYKILLKEIEENTRKWEATLVKVNIVKMDYLTNVTQKQCSLIKVSMALF